MQHARSMIEIKLNVRMFCYEPYKEFDKMEFYVVMRKSMGGVRRSEGEMRLMDITAFRIVPANSNEVE
jgi:hypothetical protein